MIRVEVIGGGRPRRGRTRRNLKKGVQKKFPPCKTVSDDTSNQNKETRAEV